MGVDDEEEEEEEEEHEYEGEDDEEHETLEMQHDVVANEAEEVQEVTSFSEDVDSEDLQAIETLLEASLSSLFSRCEIAKKNGPRKIEIECLTECNGQTYVGLSKHNGQGGSFLFTCMGQKGKRYCVSENCGGGRPGANYQCNKCSVQFTCVDNVEDVEFIQDQVPGDCLASEFMANF